MQRTTAVLLLTLTLLLLPTLLLAEEGMWLMSQLDELDLDARGIELSASEIYSPDGVCLLDAIVNMGGASGAFVSDKGLILTNHHVAFGAIQRASTGETDYLKNGFIAQSMVDEIVAPGSYARIIIDIQDVTDEVRAAADGIKDPLKRKRAIQRKTRELEEAVRAQGEDLECRIAELFEGGKYEQYTYKRFEDIRIVFAPPQSIGNYGSEIDNWMWPRHTGDFTFLRAYVSPDGVGREYDETNVPYTPDNHLKISTDDLDNGDETFIIGFPAKTDRYKTHTEVAYYRDHVYPYAIEHNKYLIDLIEGACDGSDRGAIISAGRTRGLYNGMKKYKGVLKGMYEENFLEERTEYDAALQDFVELDKELKKSCKKVLPNIEKLYEKKIDLFPLSNVYSMVGWYGAYPLSSALSAYSYAREALKPEEERDPDFNDETVKRTVRYTRFKYINVFEPIERGLLIHTLQLASELPKKQRIEAIDDALETHGGVLDLVDYLFDGTQTMDVDFILSLFEMSAEEIEAIDDPMVQFAVALYEQKDKFDESQDSESAAIDLERMKYLEMIGEMEGTPYPDASATVRMTMGKVAGYSPRDAVWYEPFTTLTGVREKDTGVWPFNMPPKLRELSEAGVQGIWGDPDLKDVPVAFLHICDITGGNSGSPVMNARGKMIGIAFDGNFEALLGDWKFMPEITRTISVDTRYVMYVTQKWAEANWLIEEMGIENRVDAK